MKNLYDKSLLPFGSISYGLIFDCFLSSMNLSTLFFNISTFLSSFISRFCLIFGVAVLIFFTTSLNSNPNFLKFSNLFFNAFNKDDSSLKFLGFTSDNLAKFLQLLLI
jgi:hypothetical protein